jgi:hypothetical protein
MRGLKVWYLGLLIAFIVGPQAGAQNASERRYTWITNGIPTGEQIVALSPDGTVKVAFAYRDRGRGPDLEATLALNSLGVPDKIVIHGLNNTRAKIEESFTRTRSVASWQSSSENGTQPAAQNAFYIPLNTVPEIRAILARALLRAPGHRLELLPKGSASIARVASTKVSAGGRSQVVTLYAIAGLDLGPSYIWLDASRQLFAYSEGKFSIIGKGWEGNLTAIANVDREMVDRHYAQLTQRLTTHLTGLTAVRGAKVFDSLAGRITPPATVFVWNGKISEVSFDDSPIPAGATVIEAKGKTLMPALWDMHNHVEWKYLPEYAAFGILNVRDMGSNDREMQHLLAKIENDAVIGPDIYAYGLIDKRGATSAPVGKSITNLDEGLQAVRYYARHGYRGIKVYSSMDPAWIPSITKAAHDSGLPVAGHIPAFMSTNDAIISGYNEITHVNQLLMAFFHPEKVDTSGPQRFLVPGINTRDLDIDSAQVNDFIALMKEHDVVLDATLAPIMEMFRNEPGKVSPLFSNAMDHVPFYVQRIATMTPGYNQGHETEFVQSSNVLLQLVAKLHRAGVTILPGTDSPFPAFTLLRELEYYSEAGIPNNAILQLATIVPARRMGQDRRLGSISPGKDAYMYLVSGDPTTDLRALYKVDRVIKGKAMFDATEVMRSLGYTPFIDREGSVSLSDKLCRCGR